MVVKQPASGETTQIFISGYFFMRHYGIETRKINDMEKHPIEKSPIPENSGEKEIDEIKKQTTDRRAELQKCKQTTDRRAERPKCP
eukprot:967022-Ditylum_brightwellii.AAC.1